MAAVAPEHTERHFGYLSAFAGLDNPASSRITRELLDWTPTRPGLIARLDGELDLPGAVSESA